MPDTSNLSRFSDTSVLCRGERFEVYIDRDEIRRRVAEIGEEISLHYAGKNPVLIGVLHGACMFLADLLRVLTIDCEVDFRRLVFVRGRAKPPAVRSLNGKAWPASI